MAKILNEEEKQKIQAFLEKVQQDFSDILGVMVAVCKVIDTQGNIILRLMEPPSICKTIMSVPKGMEGCNTSCEGCNAMVKTKDKAELVKCHAGFLGFYLPIEIDNEKVGAITGCAGLIPEDISEEKVKEIYEKMADDYEIKDKNAFVNDVISNVKRVSEDKMNESLELLKTTLSILSKEAGLTDSLFV